MQESRATILLVVPLMLEMFYKRIVKSATAEPKQAKKFRLGLQISGLLRKVGIDRRRQLFAPIHESFGGHLRLLISGGAAIDPAIIQGKRNFGIESLQGYGLTECAPILALNRVVDYSDTAAGLPYACPGNRQRSSIQMKTGSAKLLGPRPELS
jgi:long-chain acyl-CoA synthetase